jgi:hypothetical protein
MDAGKREIARRMGFPAPEIKLHREMRTASSAIETAKSGEMGRTSLESAL